VTYTFSGMSAAFLAGEATQHSSIGCGDARSGRN
jgi:hypothetical protein